ncbi:MAG TPA: sulfurtransferase TusA family protein [Sphingomonadales bacterium]
MARSSNTAPTLDVTGLRCPMPVLRAGKALREMLPGEELLVLATDPMAELDLRHFCAEAGHEFISCEQKGEILHLRVRCGSGR